MRIVYRARRAALLDALEQAFGARIGIAGEEAGMHLVITFDGDDVELSRRAAERGILATPPSIHYTGRARRSGLVLGYGGFTERQLRDAVVGLRRVFDSRGH